MENNLSYQTVKPLGISQIGSRDPLQGLTRPDFFVPTDGLDDLADQGFTITGEDVLDTTLDFIPVAGGIKDIYKGVRDGDGWQVAIGAGSIVLDIFTLGGASIVKGGIKTGIKAGGRVISKKAKRTLRKGVLARRAARKKAVSEAAARFKSVDDLINAANVSRLRKGPLQGFVKGDGESIFTALTKDATPLGNGRYLLKDGTNIGKHYSARTGDFTINFNRNGRLYKIRIIK